MGLQTVNDDASESQAAPTVSLPTPYYTYILMVCIGAVFVTQIFTSTDPQFVLVDRFAGFYVGFDKSAFVAGDYWRIFTGTLVHSGLIHFGMNSYALYSFGRLMELLSNRAHVAIVFLLSALGGDFLSLVLNPDGGSVGASGGIVGFLSYLAVYAFKRRKFISREFRKSLLVNIGFLLIFGLVLFNLVDNYAHVGGLLVGAIYGLVQIPGDEYADPREASNITRYSGIAALGFYVLITVLTILILINAAPILIHAE